MKYKMVIIDGDGVVSNYRKRAYIIDRQRMLEMQDAGNHFVTRETIEHNRVYKCCEDNKVYFVIDYDCR